MPPSASAEAVVRDYYDALRDGDPLPPYFSDADSTVKFGISESLFGGDDVAAALEAQTETTEKWVVESQGLAVTDRGGFATFADEVTMAWTETATGDRHRFDSRWSGTLVERDGADDPRANAWQFVAMHVSAPREL
ncbi:nuclear transport factor 2 family protein [Natrinema altunense]|uniref:DUF3225 domain-containing protein n=1 Tax=Natrinema altunense TaxID=222984 RepID=A0A482Y200_9EURY|nr:nuclear transport factor 2 family protein [Natrinema altunense]RZH66767.1 DUF3225 domain-containing protein [Natrinema altunense]